MNGLNLHGYDPLEPGRLLVISGGEHAGKTELALRWAAAAIEQYWAVLFINADLDLGLTTRLPPWASPELFWLVHPSAPHTVFAGALTACASDIPCLVVVDSINGLQPNAHERRQWLNQKLPSLIGAAYAHQTCLIITQTLNSKQDPQAAQLTCYSSRWTHLTPQERHPS